MESELTCAVCSDIYLEGKRDPVTLPECGHTFCRQCLLNLERSGILNCPYCRTRHHGPSIAQMSTVYALLNLTKFLRRSKFGICDPHSSTLDFWCQTCHIGLCGFCLYESHNKYNHEVVIMKTAMDKKKSEIQSTGKSFLEEINKVKLSVMEDVYSALSKVSELCCQAKTFSASIKDIKELMASAEESLNMERIMNVGNKIQELQSLAKERLVSEGVAFEVTETVASTPISAASQVMNSDSASNQSPPASDHSELSEHLSAAACAITDLPESTTSRDSKSDTETKEISPLRRRASLVMKKKPASRKNSLQPRASPSFTDEAVSSLRESLSGEPVTTGLPVSDVNSNELAYGHPVPRSSADDVNIRDMTRLEASQSRENDMAASEEGTDSAASDGWLAWSVKSDDGREGRLRWEDGRLHLYSLTDEGHDVYGTLKLSVVLSMLPSSPIVFMDLGLDGVCFGRVYIQIWGELRRAQHFLALCVGSLGPSYKGSRCSKVEGKDKPGECLRVNHYVTLNGGITARGLMDGLEWSGEYSAVKKEGLVVAASGGKSEYDGCFDICTRGNPAKKFSCPFGEVMSGIEYVKEATCHDPIGDLAIMNTGVVILDHTK